jgi:Rho-binding antiterminator
MVAYEPVACAFHERLEFAVLRRQRLDLHWLGEDGSERAENVLPVDVETRDGAEWLTVRRRDGEMERIRLDRIHAARQVESRE